MTEDKIFQDLCAGTRLQWAPQLGLGFLPGIDSKIYDAEYFEKYLRYENTPLGEALTAARVRLVNSYCKGKVVDVGIGSGHFLSKRNSVGLDTRGTDVNPFAVQWLNNDNIMWRPGDASFFPDALTFWDSLEHIPDPSALLGDVKKYVFVSCPTYSNAEHALRSKHYRPGEHCWYWTHRGILNFMEHFGFYMVECNFMERNLGREDINTYVFCRIAL